MMCVAFFKVFLALQEGTEEWIPVRALLYYQATAQFQFFFSFSKACALNRGFYSYVSAIPFYLITSKLLMNFGFTSRLAHNATGKRSGHVELVEGGQNYAPFFECIKF